MRIIESFFQSNWEVIVASPIAFLGTFAVGIVVGFLITNYLNKIKVESLNERIKLKDDKLKEFEEKLNGATPDAAQSRILDLEKRLLAVEPNKLSDKQTDLLTKILSKSPAKVSIVKDGTGSKHLAIVKQIEKVFRNAGWQSTSGMALGISSPPKTGISISTANDEQISNFVFEAFAAANIEFDKSAARTNRTADEIEILITDPEI